MVHKRLTAERPSDLGWIDAHAGFGRYFSPRSPQLHGKAMNLPRLPLWTSLRCWTFVTVIGFCGLTAAQTRSETVATGLKKPVGCCLPSGRPFRGDGAARPHAADWCRRKDRRSHRRPASHCGGRAGRPARRARRLRLRKEPHAVFLLLRARRRRLGQQHRAGPRQSVDRRHEAEGAEDHLQPAAQGGEPRPLRLPHRRGARRHALLTLGDRFSRKEDAQKLDNHLGKIVRIGKDGSVPKANPFVGKAGALPRYGATDTATGRAPRSRPTAVSG